LLKKAQPNSVNQIVSADADLFPGHVSQLESEDGSAVTCDCSALCLALIEEHEEVALLLLDNGANVRVQSCTHCTFRKWSPIHLAVAGKMINVLSRLLADSGTFIDAVEKSRESDIPTPLHVAAMKGGDALNLILGAAQRQGTQFLHKVLNEPAPAEPKSISGLNVMHIACKYASIESIKTVVNAGADVEARAEPSMKSPLHFAVEVEDAEAVRYLCELGVDTNATDSDMMTPLHLAAASYTPVDTLNILKQYGSNINARCFANNTFAHIAAEDPEKLSWAIENGADLGAEDIFGQSPLFMAKSADSFDVYISAQANLTKVAYSNHTIVHDCAKLPLRECKTLLQQLPKKFLHEAFSMKSYIMGSVTPLYIAAYFGNLELVKFFVDQGANVNSLGDPFGSAVRAAWAQRHFELASYLLDKGARLGQAVFGHEHKPAHFWELDVYEGRQSENGIWV
jgi:ankyrin repeat protein